MSLWDRVENFCFFFSWDFSLFSQSKRVSFLTQCFPEQQEIGAVLWSHCFKAAKGGFEWMAPLRVLIQVLSCFVWEKHQYPGCFFVRFALLVIGISKMTWTSLYPTSICLTVVLCWGQIFITSIASLLLHSSSPWQADCFPLFNKNHRHN